jgi:NAD(P)-dependent dehydrogenase (short-subunit alcohol dehydrogenase family)
VRIDAATVAVVTSAASGIGRALAEELARHGARGARLRGFSESLRAELHGSSVGLTCVYPGPVDTGLVRRLRARVLIGLQTRAIDWATRLAPGLTQTAVARLRGRVPFL